MLCDVLNASLHQNVISFHFIPVIHLVFPCFYVLQHCTWALTYNTAEAQKAPIIFLAHVFEEVEVFQLNAKKDLLGLSPGLRQFSLLLTLF